MASAALIAMPPSSEPENPDSDPIRRPTGVRAPATMTEVFAAPITVPPGDGGDRTGGRLVHLRSWESCLSWHECRGPGMNRTRDVFELCACPQTYSRQASHRAEHLVAPTTTRRHRLFADSLLCSTLEFNGWLQHFALGVLMATHLSLVTVWRRWDLCGWRAAGVSAELSGSLLRVRNRTGCAARCFTEKRSCLQNHWNTTRFRT